MKQTKFYFLLLAGIVISAVSMMISCAEDEMTSELTTKFTTERIVLNFQGNNNKPFTQATRSGLEASDVSRGVLTNSSGDEMGYTCVETPWPDKTVTLTRASLTSTEDINGFGVCASVYPADSSYTSAVCSSYINNEYVEPGVPMNYFYPTADYKMSFFAYYPYSESDTNAFHIYSANSTGAVAYYYCNDATGFNCDIMTGQVVDRLGGSTEPVDITLSHRCAAVHVNITNNREDTIQINDIAFSDITVEGRLRENSWYEFWPPDYYTSFSPNLLVAPDTTINITGTDDVFMMIPQTLTEYAALGLTVDGVDYTTSISGEWQQGKQYTYSVSVEPLVLKLDRSSAGDAFWKRLKSGHWIREDLHNRKGTSNEPVALMHVPYQTTVNELVNMFQEGQRYDISVYKGSSMLTNASAVIGTGYRVILRDSKRKIVDEVYVVIKGDVNGDGVVNSTDLTTIVNYVRGRTTLTQYQFLAGDVNCDGVVNMNDRTIINNFINGTITEEEMWSYEP